MIRLQCLLVILLATISPIEQVEIRSVYTSPDQFIRQSRFKQSMKKALLGIETNERTFSTPMGIEISDRFIAVCDTGNRSLWIINRKRNRIRQVSPPGGFLTPIDVVFDTPHCYVSDSDGKTVWTFHLEKKTWAKIPGVFNRPTGLCYSSSHEALLITDTEAHTVFSWKNDTLTPIMNQGLNFPTDVAEYSDSILLVADTMDHQVDVRGWDGKQMGTIGAEGDGEGFFSFIRSIAVDHRKFIYVSDVRKDWIQVFNLEGTLLTIIGGGQTFHHPTYLTYFDNFLWVSDSHARRIIEISVS